MKDEVAECFDECIQKSDVETVGEMGNVLEIQINLDCQRHAGAESMHGHAQEVRV